MFQGATTNFPMLKEIFHTSRGARFSKIFGFLYTKQSDPVSPDRDAIPVKRDSIRSRLATERTNIR